MSKYMFERMPEFISKMLPGKMGCRKNGIMICRDVCQIDWMSKRIKIKMSEYVLDRMAAFMLIPV